MFTTEQIVISIAWLCGGFISGVSGIGGAMFAVPIAATFIPMHEVIALSCILNVAMDTGICVMQCRFCRLRAIIPMLAGTIPGSIAGLYILKFMPGNVLQGGVGLLLLFYVWWQHASRKTKPHGESAPVGAAAGFAAGVLGTAISFDGPPVGAYGLYAGWPSRVFLGTISVFFVIRGALTCVLQGSAGFYTPTIINYALYGIPATFLGTLLAYPVTKHIPQAVFRRVLKFVIAVAGAICLVRAFLPSTLA
ncbi:MAG: hypothetical protein AUJ49_08930 [Desulfovibrionaceae bacterium CG1_02_65_16]|nr:MAG: hypothetical protein AUJ49_08930 [Desulfovibrionaceae bacterium CG1_02_65_16]